MNPWLVKILPYALVAALACGAGFSGAWYVQGVRLQGTRNDFEKYKVGIETVVVEQDKAAAKQQEEASNAWAKSVEYLRGRQRAGWVPQLPAAGGLRVPPAGSTDGAGGNPIPPATRTKAACDEQYRPIIEACGRVTLQLNALQGDVQTYQDRTDHGQK